MRESEYDAVINAIPREWYEHAARELNDTLKLDPPIALDLSDKDLHMAVMDQGHDLHHRICRTGELQSMELSLVTWICAVDTTAIFEMKTGREMDTISGWSERIKHRPTPRIPSFLAAADE